MMTRCRRLVLPLVVIPVIAGCALSTPRSEPAGAPGKTVSTEKGSLTIAGSAAERATILLTAGKRDFRGWLSSKDPTNLVSQLPAHVRFIGGPGGNAVFRGHLRHRGSPFVVVDGCRLLFDGRLDLPSGMGYVWLRDGATFHVGRDAWINNYTGTDQNTRELLVRGDPGSKAVETFEIAPDFLADKCGFDPETGKHSWQPKGFCQLTIINATLKTHSTSGIPSMLKKYRGRLVRDSELNFLGESQWIVDTEHQVCRGTVRSWRDLTIVTHKDLTVMCDDRIPNSRFGDRNITKRGAGTLDVSCRQFYYRGPPHMGQTGAIPTLRVEQGRLLLRTNPYEYEAGEGGAKCVAPRTEITEAGTVEFWNPGSTIESLESAGTLTFRRHGRLKITGNCELQSSSTIQIPMLRNSRRKSPPFLHIGGDLKLAGVLVIEDPDTRPGTYSIFSAAGKLSGQFDKIRLGAGLTGTLDAAGQLAVEPTKAAGGHNQRRPAAGAGKR